jgi:hypothetical protein
MKLFLATIFVTLSLTTVSMADYFSCMHDAASARQECLRWAAENGVDDANCNPEYNYAVRTCQRLSR